MEPIKRVPKFYSDHATGKLIETEKYRVGDKEFDTLQEARKVVIEKWVADLLNANQDCKKQLEDLGRDYCIHLRWTGELLEVNHDAVIQCKYCDPVMKKLAKEVIALRCNP